MEGIDKALQDFDLDAVIAPTDNPAWATDLLYGDRFLFGSSGLAAGAGYPSRPIRLLLPFAPGGSLQLVQRGADGFEDYFRQLTEFEPRRASQFGIAHYTWLCLNPKEGEDLAPLGHVAHAEPHHLVGIHALDLPAFRSIPPEAPHDSCSFDVRQPVRAMAGSRPQAL